MKLPEFSQWVALMASLASFACAMIITAYGDQQRGIYWMLTAIFFKLPFYGQK
jgi:hypothetical protein